MHIHQTTSRRRFVKLFAFGVVGSGLCGRFLSQMIIGEAQAGGVSAGILTLKLSSFPVLQSSNSSIRLALNSFEPNGPNGAYYPILVNRTTGNQFYALEARCTHEGWVVPTGTNSCPGHGSRFNLDGTVLQPPAISSLTRYTVTYDNNDLLTIEVPGLGYSITGSAIQTTPGPRFQLTFPTQSGLTYEVQYRENLASGGVAVPFFIQTDGDTSQMSIVGTGATFNVFVSRTNSTGFYTVNVKAVAA